LSYIFEARFSGVALIKKTKTKTKKQKNNKITAT
jgi:hypothetical protein